MRDGRAGELCQSAMDVLQPVAATAERVKAVYVISRVIECVELGGNDLTAKLRALGTLPKRDNMNNQLACTHPRGAPELPPPAALQSAAPCRR